MKCVVGVDLGSTTTKAVVLDERGEILGRGLTNSRSNYDLAVEVARTEAFNTTRFELLRRRVSAASGETALTRLLRAFRMEQTLHQMRRLHAIIDEEIDRGVVSGLKAPARAAVKSIFARLETEEIDCFERTEAPGRSDFFRDIAGSSYTRISEEIAPSSDVSFDLLLGLFDKCIIKVENEPLALGFRDHIGAALARIGNPADVVSAVEAAVSEEIVEAATVGTGYGRARLPFPKEQIRSEILCHGLGAHAMFPMTRTVLDIGNPISLFAADGFLEGGGENGRQSRSVPVKSEHRSERLKPDRIGNPLHKFIRPIFCNDHPRHLPSQFHHTLKKPFGTFAIIEGKCGNSAFEHTITISLFVTYVNCLLIRLLLTFPLISTTLKCLFLS